MAYIGSRNILALPVLLLASALVVGGCKKDDNNPVAPSKAGTFYGTPVTMGNASVKSYVTLDANGNPTAIGLRMAEAALTGLPSDPADPANSMVVPFPSQGSSTLFTHILLDWNPQGHPPQGIYTVPHFDIHFYLLSNDERLTITPTDTVKGRRIPDPSDVPAGYFNGVDIVPMMGVHWINGASPELHGQPFTYTLIYGFWDAKLAFIEPMITKAFIESKQSTTADVPQPAAFQRAGFYPTKYSIAYDSTAKEYVISITDFLQH